MEGSVIAGQMAPNGQLAPWTDGRKLGEQEPRGTRRLWALLRQPEFTVMAVLLKFPPEAQRKLPVIWIWLKVSLGCGVLPVLLPKVCLG